MANGFDWDYRGIFWIGTEGDGLYRFDEHKKTFRHFAGTVVPGSLSSTIITDIKEGKFGELWITTDGGGLNRLDLLSEEFESYKHDPQNGKSVSNNSSYSIYIDDRQNLWLGMGDGVANVSISTPFTTYLPSPLHKENGIGFQVVVAALIDSKINCGSAREVAALTDLISTKEFSEIIAISRTTL